MADVGRTGGSESHRHQFSGTTSDARADADGWHVTERGAPAATGLDHSHTLGGTTGVTEVLPPYTDVLFMMKL